MPNKPYPKLSQLLNEIKEAQDKPAPKMSDPNLADNAPYNYFVEQLRADYKDEKIANFLKTALKELPEEKQKEFIQKAKGPNAEKNCTEQEWLPKIKRGNTYLLLDNKHWGRTGGDQLFDALTDVLPQEKLQELETMAGNLKAPDEPGYEGPLEEEPYKEKIQALKQKAALENPFAAESTARMLDEVNRHLSRVSEGYREYLGKYDQAPRNGSNSLNKMNDWTVSLMTLQGQKTLGGGKFNGTFKIDFSERDLANGNGKTLIPGDKEFHAKELTDQDIAAIKNTPSPISQTAVEAAEKIYGTMGTLAYTNPNAVVLAGDMQTFKGQKPDDIFYPGEQGIKYYAFWPLIDKKEALGKAVEEGDLDKIRTAAEEYKKTEDKYTLMMDTLKDPKLGGNKLYDGNVNSTRSSTPDMPMKFVDDNVTHNQLNSMYCLQSTARNFGVDVMDMVKDPANTTLKAYQNFKEARGIDAKSSIGGKLCWGLQRVETNKETATHFIDYESAWGNYFDAPRSRGYSGVVNLEPDPKKRAEYIALGNLGSYAAQEEVLKEVDRFQTMSDIATGKAPNAGEKRSALYRNAALLPSDQFSMEKMADAFRDKKNPERWRTELDVSAMTKGDNLFKLDYQDLASRTENVLRQHEAEKIESGAYMSAFDPDEYVLNAFSVYSQILANATPDLRGTEDFRAFEQSVKNMPNLVKNPDVKAMMAASLKVAEQPDYFSLTASKNDRVFGKQDSEEYTNMKDSLQLVGEYVNILKKGPKSEKEALVTGKGGAFAEKLQEAADDCFEYARLKTKNGAKTSFSARSGAARVEESLQALRRVHQLQDEMGLRSPAQKLYDEARLDLLTHRTDKEWMKAHGAETVAKVIHAKRAIDAKIPAKYQKAAFSPENWQQEYGKMQKRKEYRDFVSGAGPDVYDMADSVLSGDKHFTKCVDGMAKTVAAAYKKQVEEPKEAQQLANAKEDFMQGWALEVAAKELKLTPRRRFDENPKLQEKAREVRNDPKFKEVMGEMMKGKTSEELQQIKTAHVTGDRDGYDIAKARIQYEKQCAEVIVNKTMSDRLEKMDPEERRKTMDKEISRCRQMPAFQNVMNERFEDIHLANFANRLLHEIKSPQKQEELWDDMIEAQNKVLQAEAQQPVQMEPQQPQVQQNAKKQVQEDVPIQ